MEIVQSRVYKPHLSNWVHVEGGLIPWLKAQGYYVKILDSYCGYDGTIIQNVYDKDGNVIGEIHRDQPSDRDRNNEIYPDHFEKYDSNGRFPQGTIHYY